MMIGAMLMTAIAAVMVSVMIAPRVGIKHQRAFCERFCRRICGPLDACIQFDPCIGKRHLSAHADTAADQRVNMRRLQESRQSAVSAAVGVNDLFLRDRSVFHIRFPLTSASATFFLALS